MQYVPRSKTQLVFRGHCLTKDQLLFWLLRRLNALTYRCLDLLPICLSSLKIFWIRLCHFNYSSPRVCVKLSSLS